MAVINKEIVIWIILLMIPLLSNAQCPSGDVLLETQDQVDQFVLDYPDCTQLNSSLTIKEWDVVNLSFLANIISVNGNLTIHSTKAPVLPLENLESVGGNLVITNNEYIPKIEMSKISSIGGGLQIDGHYQLKVISGLQNITSLEYFSISYNWFLESIPQFNNLQSVTNDLYINENESLKKIVGFETLTCSGNIMLDGNNVLEVIDAFPAVVELTAEWGGLWIHSNSSLKTVSGFQSLERTNHIIYNQSGGSGEPNSVPTFPSLRSAGYISLRQFTMPTEYHGFKNLIEVGGVSIDGLMNIEKFSGFNKIETADYINVMENRDLKSLSAFESLQETKFEFIIKRNRKLSNISNIHNLTKIGHDFGIFSMAITNFDFIKNLKEVGDTYSRFDINELPDLVDCSSLSNLIKYGYMLEPTHVFLDLQGCSTISEIGAAADTDKDGILDIDDSDDDNDGIKDIQENAGDEFLDTDADFLPDHVDLDSDNDGCYDEDEGITHFQQAPLSPTIYRHPEFMEVASGGVVSFSADVVNADIYQWQVSDDNGNTWINVEDNSYYLNSNTPVLELQNIPANFHNNLFRLKSRNDSNVCEKWVVSRFASLTVKSTTLGDPGEDTEISLCPTEGEVDLFPLINGNPDTGGEWNPPLNSGGSVFDTSLDTEGAYQYSFRDTNCQISKANISVSFNSVPTAGANGSLTICKSGEPVNLLEKLNGTPAPGGSWTPELSGEDGMFDPRLDSGDLYTYTINAEGCASSSAAATINLIEENLSAGEDVSIELCKSSEPITLASYLDENVYSNGFWSPELTNEGIFDPVQDMAGDYTYTVSIEGCGSDEVIYSISVIDSPNPGTDTDVLICAEAGTTDLLSLINGNPDEGGVWTPSLTSGTGSFDPKLDTAGTYTYTVKNESCGKSSANLELEINNTPNPGTDAELVICSNELPVELFPLLGPDADQNGYWIPDLNDPDGNFDPEVNTSGVYEYRIDSETCGSRSSYVTVYVDALASAGESASISLCKNSPAINLFDLLGPEAVNGGLWSPSPQSGNSTFDPSIDEAGTYVYSIDLGECGTSRTEVNISLSATENIEEYAVEISDFEENSFIEINILEPGDFEYSIDGINFIPQNRFSDIAGGVHHIHVREINGCKFLTETVIILGYDKFFTPNGDGFNDYWKITGFEGELYEIYIYDRYGKLLKILSSSDKGWDGIFNGKPMPSDDYWFSLELEDGAIYRGHFSLVRS